MGEGRTGMRTHWTSSSKIVWRLLLTTHSNFIFLQRTQVEWTPSKSHRIFCFLHAAQARTFRDMVGIRESLPEASVNTDGNTGVGGRAAEELAPSPPVPTPEEPPAPAPAPAGGGELRAKAPGVGASSAADGEVLAEGGVDPLVLLLLLLLLFLRVLVALPAPLLPAPPPFASS